MGRNIGFTGPFSDANLGDYAMMVNTVYDWVTKEDRVTLFTYDHLFVERIQEDYLSDYDLTLCQVRVAPEQGQMSKWQQILRRIGGEANRKPAAIPIDLLNRLENSRELYLAIAPLDLLVVTGGGYFNHYWSSGDRKEDLWAILIPMLIANQFGKKIIFAGNTFGPFDESTEFFFSFFQMFGNIQFAVRDTVYSRAHLLRLGIGPETIQYVPDDLLFLHPTLKGKRPRGTLPTQPYLVMEWYYPFSLLEEYKQELLQFQKEMKSRYGLSTVFLPFAPEEGGMDQGRCLQEFGLEMELYDWSTFGYLPVEDAVALLSHAQLVVCNRYHALVLAIGERVPVVQVLKDVCSDKRYYYSKSYGVLKEVFRGNAFDEREYLKTSLPGALEEIVAHYPLIQQSQKRRYQEEYPKNMKYLQSLRRNYYLRQLDERE